MIIKTKKEVKNWSKNFWKSQKKWFAYRFDEKELEKILKDVKRLHIKEIRLSFEKKERYIPEPSDRTPNFCSGSQKGV